MWNAVHYASVLADYVFGPLYVKGTETTLADGAYKVDNFRNVVKWLEGLGIFEYKVRSGKILKYELEENAIGKVS